MQVSLPAPISGNSGENYIFGTLTIMFGSFAITNINFIKRVVSVESSSLSLVSLLLLFSLHIIQNKTIRGAL